jgi:hypothetical protein
MLEFITQHIDTIGILISAFAALLTAVATFSYGESPSF